MVINKEVAEKYQWGNNCDAWVLLENDGLSIKQERMPSGSSESLHLHKNAQQFFYVLNGQATMEKDGEKYYLNSGEGIHIAALCKHRILNETNEDLDFLVISEPMTKGDRNEIE